MTDNANALSAGYQFRHLTAFSPDALEQIEAIYQESFPVNERKPFWMVSNAILHDLYSVFVVSQNEGTSTEIVAFALMAGLRTSQAMYIEYLAVAPTQRNQGIGSMLMRQIIDFLKDTPTSAIVWEVDPSHHTGDDDSRRMRFYERLGGHVIQNTRPYGMPDYYRGNGILALQMMWIPLQHERTQPSKSELIAFITDIYETEYRGHDAIRDEIIANLGKTES